MNPDFPSFVCGDLAVKLCWSVKYLLRIAEVDGPSLLVIYGLMCKLFALLPDDEAELDGENGYSKLRENPALMICSEGLDLRSPLPLSI